MTGYQFCPMCGGVLVVDSGYPRCSAGHDTFVPWQHVGGAAVITKDDAVLLEQRCRKPLLRIRPQMCLKTTETASVKPGRGQLLGTVPALAVGPPRSLGGDWVGWEPVSPAR